MPEKINFNKNDMDSYSVEQSTLLRLSLTASAVLLLLASRKIANIMKERGVREIWNVDFMQMRIKS